jgi:hypothetical protein
METAAVVLDLVRGRLGRWPSIPVDASATRVAVANRRLTGFDVTLMVAHETEPKAGPFITVDYGGFWYQDFGEPEKAVRQFLLGLSTRIRIRVRAFGGRDCWWSVEHQEGPNRRRLGGSSVMLVPFWREPTVRYLQNEWIAGEDLD